tara:strand:+ start:458 stop:679 length:222 start_codon:yes stop_codon:yes gene_type:complete
MICTQHRYPVRISYLFCGRLTSAKFIAKPHAKPQTAAAQMKMTIKRYAVAAVDMFHLDAETWPLAGVTSTAGI